ncbi:Uncharacterised protein [Bordetella pertussis]|nr:Uncharacterised protein [Bordetella pertussis]
MCPLPNAASTPAPSSTRPWRPAPAWPMPLVRTSPVLLNSCVQPSLA